MILALFFVVFSFFAALCGLLIYGYRSRAHNAETRANRAEGALDQTRDENSFLRGLTEKAIRYAAEAAKMNADEVLITYEAQNTAANYVPPVTTNCPACGVSVRHPLELYPIRCPASGCGTLIDPVLDNPPEFDTT